jgi:hypothetical protein
MTVKTKVISNMITSGNAKWRRAGSALAVGAVTVVSMTSVAAVRLDAPTPKYFKMQAVQVIDQHGFAKPIPAQSLLIPSGWKFEGNVQWGNRGCFTDFAAITFHAQSPDGKIVIEEFPSFSWQFVDNPAVQKYLVAENQQGLKVGLKPCPVNPPVHATDVLSKRVMMLYRPGKQIAAMEPSPDLNKYVADRVASIQAQAGKAGKNVDVRADAARARLKYDVDGAPVEEWITTVSMALGSPSNDGRGGKRYDNRAFMILAMRAPVGQLEANERLFNAVRGSIHEETEWENQFLQIVSQLSSAQQVERQKRDQIISQFQQQEIAAIQGVTANAQAGSNQAAFGETQLLRGVETYRNPETGKQYELDSKYGNAWMDKNTNQVILSDDPNLHPGEVANGDWTPMEHVQAQP